MQDAHLYSELLKLAEALELPSGSFSEIADAKTRVVTALGVIGVGGGAPAESAVTFTDITTNNASITKHGYLPKLPNDATKFLSGLGTWLVPSGGGDALVANPLSQFATTTSLQLLGVISDETGTGLLVFNTSPTIVTPTIAKLANLSTNGFVKTSGGDGTLSVDTATYLSSIVPLILSTNLVEQYNGANSQTYRWYGTRTDASNYERGALAFTTGTGLTISAETAGTGTDDLSVALIAAGNGIITANKRLEVTGGFRVLTSNTQFASSSQLYWENRSIMQSKSDGNITISNQNENAFGRLEFGGSTSSFPALKRSGATLQARLADDSAYARFDASTFRTVGPIQNPSSGGAATIGNATLVSGTVTVSTTAALTGSSILLTRKTSGGTIGTAITYTVNNGVSFTINSDNILDTSTFTWMIVDSY